MTDEEAWALYSRVVEPITKQADDQWGDIADEVRAVLAAKTLKEATEILRRAKYYDPRTYAVDMRRKR